MSGPVVIKAQHQCGAEKPQQPPCADGFHERRLAASEAPLTKPLVANFC